MKHGIAALALAAACGCVTLYQPLTGLQRPVIVDPGERNFEGKRIELNCPPDDEVGAESEQILCARLNKVFTLQGADVIRFGEAIEEEEDGGEQRNAEGPDLRVEVRARRIAHEEPGWLWWPWFMSLTFFPLWSDSTFALTVTISDPSGVPLSSEVMEARLTRYAGVGIWLVNIGLDMFRGPDERISGDTSSQVFSRDLYGRVSQLTFNALVRQSLMRDQAPVEVAR